MAFENAFRKRFAPLDSAQSTQDMLKTIKQGRGSVAEYIAKFDQYSTLTGWSNTDHRQRFYDGLDDHVEDLFALSERPKQRIWKHVPWQAISISGYNKEMPKNLASRTCPIVTLEEEKVLKTLMLWR